MIYICFEQLGMRSPKPSLVGALTTREDAPADFTLYLLDPRLAGCAAATRACRVADLATALSEILMADGPVVWWSEDLRRNVRRAALPARLVQRFEARSVNALTRLRRWRTNVYRDWNLPALNQPRWEALKIYMKAVGYEMPQVFPSGSAATWLRHVLEGLQAAGGDDRRLSSSTKRHWRALFEHNRHECAGIRALYHRACRELALDRAYRQTTYRVEIHGRSYSVRIGRSHPVMDVVVRAAGATQWALITAHNPQSVQLRARENERRDAALKRKLHARGIRWYRSAAVADEGDWPPESGFFALGVSREWAEQIGREFGKAAVVWGHVGERAELVWCNQLQEVTRRRGSCASVAAAST